MENCSICFESTENKLECNHTTCIDCLKKLIRKSDLCPICRQTFNIIPYQYNCPRHTPNLKISMKNKKFLNKFLSNRFFLKYSKYQKFYALLMSAYHCCIRVNNKFINPFMFPSMEKYEILQLYLYFSSKNIYSKEVCSVYKNIIEEIFCSPTSISFQTILSYSHY